MEEKYNYEMLLDRLIESLPDVVKADVRFEIPKAQSSIQGNRTIIYNFSEIASTLHRKPDHILKYLLKELGTAGDIEGHRVILQGKFLPMVINKRIEAYTKEFVICPECGKPDTQIIKEDRIKFMKCMACGARHPIRNI